MESKIHVVGLGVISAIGKTVDESLTSFKNHQHGLGAISFIDSVHKQLPVGEVRISNQQLATDLGIKKSFNRTTLLGIYAARQARKSIKLSSHWRTGVISGTTVGGMDRTETIFPEYLRNSAVDFSIVKDHECGSVTERIAEDLGATDYISTINTACSSSVNSIILASRLIRQGHVDIAIAGGVDSLTKFTLNGFNSLMILDKELCKPFDADRNGLNLGEGAGYLALVSQKVLDQERLKSLCTVSGHGNNNDAFHQTASSADGRGSFLAMESALQMSRLKPNQIDYINLHGTGTKNNDSSEGVAVQRLFGEQVPHASSTKSFTGHTLGASGGIEAVFSVMSLIHGCVFPNLRFNSQMAEVNFSPVGEFMDGLQVKHAMSNSFGFGGNCSSIIFSK